MKSTHLKPRCTTALLTMASLFTTLALALAGAAFALTPDNPGVSTNRPGISSAASDEGKIDRSSIIHDYFNLPLYFEANRGQSSSPAKFLSRGPGYTLFLTPSEVVLNLESSASAQTAVRMQLAGAAEPEIRGLEPSPTKVHYFKGSDPEGWMTDIPTYKRVRYDNVYPGIDLVFYGNQGELEYDFVVAPGTDPQKIRMAFRGAENRRLDQSGNLVLETGSGELLASTPTVYQEIDGRKKEIPGKFELLGDNEVGFKVAAYDRQKPLIIDPVLIYSTFLGGGNADEGVDITLDSSGSIYLTGRTSSPDFPTQSPLDGSVSGQDAFITKLSADGSSLVFSTYLGGGNIESGNGIAVDGSGNVYVTGTTGSFPGFPTTAGAYQTTPGGALDAFVVKLNPSGSSLVYSTLFGGTGPEDGRDIVLDGAGNAYVTGTTSSGFGTFPVPPPGGGFDVALNGPSDAYVIKVTSDGSGLDYFNYIGRGGSEEGNGVALDTSNNAYVTGRTNSPVGFPPFTVGSFQTTPGGGYDAFVVKVNPTGSDVVYGTYLGGSADDMGLGIDVNAAGEAYVAGATASNDFPLASPLQPNNNGGTADAFISGLNVAGSTLVFSTYLGGGNDDRAQDIALDGAGHVYVTGSTESPSPTFPVNDPLSGGGSLTGPQDAFAARIDTVGGSFVYSTYLGGSGSEAGVAIAVDSNENAYITGNTNSANFPTQNAFQSTSGGSIEAFVAKIGEVPPLAVSPDNVTMAVGSSASSNISGGLSPYSGSSADSSIATVSVSGSTATITGVNAGSTTVTITDSIGSTAAINATVSAAVPPLTVSQDNVTLAATTSTDINISGGETPYTATSDDTTVATASVSGSTLTIDGVAVGTATVTVTDNATDSTTVDVTVTEAPPLEIGGCAQGTLVSETVDTASFDEITLNLCQEPPSTLSGRLYISIEAPSTLPGLMFFRPQDDAIPPGGSFVVLVRDSSGFLPDAEDNFFRQGTLSAAAGDVTFIVGTEGLEGLSPVFKTWYLPQGLDLNEVNLQVIQSVTITFN